MACNYSSKFLPLVISLKEGFEADNSGSFEAFVQEQKLLNDDDPNKLFTNWDDAVNEVNGIFKFAEQVEQTKQTEYNVSKPIDTRQAKMNAETGNNIKSAYVGRSEAYSEMIKNFGRKILEESRIKIDFDKGIVTNVDSNALNAGITNLNRSLFDYKISLLENVLERNLTELRDSVKADNINSVNDQLNALLNEVQLITEIDPKVYDSYVILSNFDALIEQECPYIKIDTRYGNKDGVNKYEYIGSKVEHFTGWTSSEYADSMDQASMLVKAILNYIPEVNVDNKPIKGSSIGLTGFYNTMTSMRDALLYKSIGDRNTIAKELQKGVNADISVLIDSYLDYLKATNDGSTASYYDSSRTNLIGKLRGIRNFIFDKNLNLDDELRNIFNNMFYKNIQMGYTAYSYDFTTDKFDGKDLKASLINPQVYALSGTIASAIYNFRKNRDSWDKIIGDDSTSKYQITTQNRFTGEFELKYNDKIFKFGKSPNGKQDLIFSDFTVSEFRDIFEDLFGYIIPDTYKDMSTQISGREASYKEELGQVLRIGISGSLKEPWGNFEFDNNYPTNLNANWYADFAAVGQVISAVYGSDVVNVVKNVSGRNNLPLFGLNSLAYNFPFIMWNHQSDTSDNNIYKNSFLFDQTNSDGSITMSVVKSPKVRSEILYNGQLKSASKLTVSEVTKLAILKDFYQNYNDGDHIYLQNATFADKGTHFLINYDLNTPIYGDKTLRELIKDQMETSSPNETGLFELMYDTRKGRITQLVDNIIEDYSLAFGKQFNTLEEIESAIKNMSQNDIRQKFLNRGLNFYEEIHASKGKINETIKNYYNTFRNREALEKRLDAARVSFANSLDTNRIEFSTLSDSTTQEIGKTYPKWTNPDGSIKSYEKVGNKVKLHPVLEAYFMTDALLSNEYNEVMIGGVYAHSKSDEAGRLIAQIKRSVIFGATMHSFAQGLESGVADTVKIACMPDVQATVQNIVGTEQQNDSMDGSGLCTMLQARLESNSLLDARTGYDKKTIGHDIDSKYGRPSLLKWAVYALTNARRRIAYGSAISQDTLVRKMYSASNIGLTTEELNNALKSIGDVYFKDVLNTGNYYRIAQFKIENEQIITALEQVNESGEVLDRTTRAIPYTDTLWDIDQAFGGAFSMRLVDGTLQYAEGNNDALEYYATKVKQSAKTAQIGYAVNKSAMKVGVGNLNTEASWTDTSNLQYITMRTRYIGVQMDAEHHLDENEVTEMTQMISALSENGYTSQLVNQIYSDIGNVIVEALNKYDEAINSGNADKIYKLLGEAFIKSFEENDRDTIGLAQAFVLKASNALKEGNLDFRIPFSAETVNGIFISTISSMLTKKGIRRKYEGFAGVLTPAHNMMQYYNVGGQNILFEQFADVARQNGISPLQAINDVWINGKLNPFIVPINASDVDFEDTVVIFDTSDGITPLNGSEQLIYIDSYTKYDTFKHLDLSGKLVYNFTSKPKNLKATNTKFLVNGINHSVYDLDAVRAMFQYKESGTMPESFIGKKSEYAQYLQNWIQSELRNLAKGREITLNGIKVIPTNVIVTPAQLMTGRYNAKKFMLSASDNVASVTGMDFFENKLLDLYSFTDDEPDWAETVLFTENGERYLVRTVTPEQRAQLMTEGFVTDNTIEEFNGNFYKGEDLITSLPDVSFHKKEINGKVWNVILTSEESKNKLFRSSYFDMYRHNYVPDTDKNAKKMADEQLAFRLRIKTRASRMYDSFKEQLQMLGTRIPTQAMQSFMPMEIVGFTDSEINDVYVPVQQTFTQGSDYDKSTMSY